MNAAPALSQFMQRATPRVQVLLLEFPPITTAALWHAATALLPAIEIRMTCRTCEQLAAQNALTGRYDVILVNADDHERWFEQLLQSRLKLLMESCVVVAGRQELQSVQTQLLRAGYADVVCTHDTNPKSILNTVTKAYLRELRRRRIELPSTLAALIQRALI